MLATHNLLGTWANCVTTYIALTEFARRKFIEGGIPEDLIDVKPNFVADDLGPGSGDGDYILYVGRLSEEKGVRRLLDAWKQTDREGRLLIIGDGPLSTLVRESVATTRSIVYLGRVPLQQVYEYMGRARALVFPSVWYEGMPRVVIESFCRGTPVIAIRLGSMQEMIEDSKTGWFAETGSVASLASILTRFWRAPDAISDMRLAARAEFESKYTAELNYAQLMSIYRRAIARYDVHSGAQV
jgi:glycosyltransferase involved in cell wall biosynthesis